MKITILINSLLCASTIDYDVRLVGTEFASEGTVEIFYDGSWGSICDDLWDRADTGVVCEQLGFPGPTISRSIARSDFLGLRL